MDTKTRIEPAIWEAACRPVLTKEKTMKRTDARRAGRRNECVESSTTKSSNNERAVAEEEDRNDTATRTAAGSA